MTLCEPLRLGILVGAALGLCQSPGAAQVRREVGSVSRDSLLSCAAHKATAAGFRAVSGVQAGRLGMMRTRVNPDSSSLLDGLRVAIAAQDSVGTPELQVRVTTFVIARATGLTQREVAPPQELTALADSIRVTCRGPRKA